MTNCNQIPLIWKKQDIVTTLCSQSEEGKRIDPRDDL